MRVKFEGLGCVSAQVHLANVAHAWSLDPKRITPWGNGPLAVVGSGPSLDFDRLRTYSEVWGINRMAARLCAQGIPAAMFTVDPIYQPTQGIERAIVASCCDPRMLVELQGKDVSVFPMSLEEGEGWAALAGVTSACRVPLVALKAGFTRIDFYGCEGNCGPEYEPETPERLIVMANGREFTTIPGLLMQCEALVELITAEPEFARNESGGLLKAMLADPDWEMVGFSHALALKLYGDVSELPPFEGMTA